MLSKVVVPIYTPTSSVREFLLLHILPTLAICQAFKFLTISWCKMLSHCYSICISLIISKPELLRQCFYHPSFFSELPVPFMHLLNCWHCPAMFFSWYKYFVGLMHCKYCSPVCGLVLHITMFMGSFHFNAINFIDLSLFIAYLRNPSLSFSLLFSYRMFKVFTSISGLLLLTCVVYEVRNVVFFPMLNNNYSYSLRDDSFLTVYFSLVTTVTQEISCEISLVKSYNA